MIHRRTLLATAAATLAAPAILRAQTVQTLSFYYPIAVGGPIPAIVEGYCREFRAESGIEVVPVFAGNYSETLTKAVTATKAGQGPQLAVLLAAEMHSLQDLDILVSLDEIGFDADTNAGWTGSFPRSSPIATSTARRGRFRFSAPRQSTTTTRPPSPRPGSTPTNSRRHGTGWRKRRKN